MFPNFCFSRKSNESGGMSVKTLQCLKDARTTNIKKRKKSPSKSPRRLKGGSCMGTNDATTVHVNGILKKNLCKRISKGRSRSSSPAKNNHNNEEKQTKNPHKTERSVNFNLSGTKCHCANCPATRSDIRKQWEKEYELKRAEFNRMKDLQRKRAEQRREREKRVHDCLKGTDKESDQESSEEYQEQKKLSVVLEQLRKQQQKRLVKFLDEQISEDNDGDGDDSKRLQESCADFLNIVHDNILETVQTAIRDKLSKYYDSTINKINCLTAQVARNESLLKRINSDLLEKIKTQNEVNNNQLKFIVQKLNKQNPNQRKEAIPDDVYIESCSSNNDRPTGGDSMNTWIMNQSKGKEQQSVLKQKQDQQQQQPSVLQNISQPKPSMNKKNCQCDHHHSTHLSRHQQYQEMNPQFSREQFDMQQQIHQLANYQMMNKENKDNNNNMQFPYPMSCQNYLMWLNWNLAAHYSNQKINGNTSKKSMLSSTTTTTSSRTRFKRTCKRFGSTSLPNIHASKAKLHSRSCLISNRCSSPRFMNIVNVASQHSEHKEKLR